MTHSSKENLSKIPEGSDGGSVGADPAPFKFTRSLSMASIPIRQSFRRVFRENKLEKLHEENSSEKVDKIADTISPPETPHTPEVELRKKPLQVTVSADSSAESRERRISFLATLRDLRRSIAYRSGDMPMNSKWSASLASLQQIDTMVSYENLSFIDYDKFNTYEKLLQKQSRVGTSNGNLHRADANTDRPFVPPSKVRPMSVQPAPVSVKADSPVRMRKHSIAVMSSDGKEADVNANFDSPKNLYRQSLDERKLQLMNKMNRQSFRWSKYCVKNAEDVLMLDKVSKAVDIDDVDEVDFGRKRAVASRSASIRRRLRNGGSGSCSPQTQSMVELRSLVGVPSWSNLPMKVSRYNYCFFIVLVNTLKDKICPPQTKLAKNILTFTLFGIRLFDIRKRLSITENS